VRSTGNRKASHCTRPQCRLPASRSTVRLLQMTGRTFRSTVMALVVGSWPAISSAPARTGSRAISPLCGAASALSRRVCPYFMFSTSGKRVGQRLYLTLACVYGGLVVAAGLLDDKDLLRARRICSVRIRDSAVRLGRFVKSNESDDVDASILWLSTPFRVVEQAIPALPRQCGRSRHGSVSMAASSLPDRHVLRKRSVAGSHGVARLALPGSWRR